MNTVLPMASKSISHHLLFLRNLKVENILSAAVISLILLCQMQPAFAGRPPNKQRIFLGNFTAPATIPLTGILIPGTNAIGSVGDQVTIDAELFTTDPNENGEGEPLILISLPSLNTGIRSYFAKRSFTFKISRLGQVLNANIEGADGDETAQLNGFIDPAPPKPTYTPEEKEQFSAAGERLEILAAQEDVLAKVCFRSRANPALCEILNTASVLNSVLSQVDYALALDPPDPNFTVIDQPVIPSLPLLILGPGLSQAEVDSFNALLLNQEKIIGIARATLTAINRSVGAYDANNDLWETRQREAAALFNLQLSALHREQVTLLTNWQTALRNGSLGSLTVTPSDVLNNEIDLINFGLTPTYVAQLQQLGVDNTTIETIRNRHSAQDINQISSTFPDNLTNPDLVNSLNKAADALYEAALENATPLTRGQQVKGEGRIRNLPGNTSFEFEVKVNKSGKAVSEFELSVQSNSFNFKIIQSSVTRAALLGNIVILDGVYNATDATTGTFRVIATDSGKGNRNKDSVNISLSNGYQLNGVLDKGHIQIKTHKSDD